MHLSQKYIDNIFLPGNTHKTIINRKLTNNEALQLRECLRSDALSYIYSSTVSMGDAVRGINARLLTWATVKLYYSVFYALRSLLALENFCIFYVNRKPFLFEAKPGNIPEKGGRDASTHKMVLNKFKAKRIVPFLLSQDIEY